MNKRCKSVSEQFGRKSYSVDLTRKGFSFGLGERSSGLSLQGRNTPSPLIYRPSVYESPYKGVTIKGFSSDMKIIKRLQNRPGPGTYDPYEPFGTAAPKYSIKARLVYNNNFVTPAPNAYFPEYKKILKNTPIFTIPNGIRSKDIKIKKQVNPGPGAYNLH